MKSATLLALGFVVVGVWPQDGARAQTSVAPPVSLAPPKASPPVARAKNTRPRGEPTAVTNGTAPPAATGRQPSPPVIGGPAPSPNPATDYDGFSAGTADDDDAPSQVAPPARSRAAKGSNRDTNHLDAQSSIDQEDEALKRKLTICKNCK
jgi:hypothetical protein